MLKAGILGATGYAGQELLRLLHNHREICVAKVMSESYAGKKYDFIYRSFTGLNKLECCEANFENMAEDVDILFSALPYGLLKERINLGIPDNMRLIDLSSDFRFAPGFTYGLSEWNGEEIKAAQRIANPGCFATAAELALLPLVKEGVIERDIIIDGKCSLSGAGRELTIGTHFVEANESVKPYRITNHPHKSEIARAVEQFGDARVNLTFVPHITPMQRGILVTCYTKLKKTADWERVRSLYGEYYADARFIRMLDKGMYVETKWVKGSNMCHINFEIDENGGLIVFAAIDNLIKGAAGQAIQNMNLMLGFPESMAVDNVPLCI